MMSAYRFDLLGLISNIKAVAAAKYYFRNAILRGNRIRLWGKIIVKGRGCLIIHDRVRIEGRITPVELEISEEAVLEIGENTFINYGTSIASTRQVKIGRDCLIGTYVNITDNNFHSIDPGHRSVRPEAQPVTLADNVWLGTRVIVLPGLTIGEGSVIGAGSVVTQDIPPRVIAAGVPARIIRAI